MVISTFFINSLGRLLFIPFTLIVSPAFIFYVLYKDHHAECLIVFNKATINAEYREEYNYTLAFVHYNSVHKPQFFKQLPYLISIYSKCDSERWFHQPFLSRYSCGLDLGSTWIVQHCPCWTSNISLFLTEHFSNWSRSPWILFLPCKEFSTFISPALQLHFLTWCLVEI